MRQYQGALGRAALKDLRERCHRALGWAEENFERTRGRFAPFAARLGDLGYEAQIADRAGERTGTLFIHRAPAVVVNDELAPPNTWFVEDLIVRDHRVIIRVNGKTVVDHVDKEGVWKSGHIALQMHDPSTFVQFKKVLAKELR